MDLFGVNSDGCVLPVARPLVYRECQLKESARRSGLSVGFAKVTA